MKVRVTCVLCGSFDVYMQEEVEFLAYGAGCSAQTTVHLALE